MEARDASASRVLGMFFFFYYLYYYYCTKCFYNYLRVRNDNEHHHLHRREAATSQWLISSLGVMPFFLNLFSILIQSFLDDDV